MSDADRILLSYIDETTFGVIESGPPTLKDLRLTGETLHQEQGTVTSAEIRDDRQKSDVIRTTLNAAGDVNFELSYGVYDEWLQYLLFATAWSTIQTAGPGVTFSVTSGSGDYTVADSGNGFGLFVVGQWVRITGFTGTAAVNNGLAKITAAAAGSITVAGNGDGFTVGSGDSVTVTMGQQIINGTTLTSMNIERQYTDLSGQDGEFVVYTGMTIDQGVLNVQSDQLISGNFALMGQDEVSRTSIQGTIGNGSNTAAPTNEVMAAVDHIQGIVENGVVLGVTQLNTTIANNLRNRFQVGSAGPIGMGAGAIDVTGTLQFYYQNSSIFDRFLNQANTSLAIKILDDANQGYVIEYPNVKFTSGQRVAGSQNTDIIADMAFTAFRDATEDVTVRIARFA